MTTQVSQGLRKHLQAIYQENGIEDLSVSTHGKNRQLAICWSNGPSEAAVKKQVFAYFAAVLYTGPEPHFYRIECAPLKSYRQEELADRINNALIREATKLWRSRCDAFINAKGDVGPCVIGAGIYVWLIKAGRKRPEQHFIITPHEVSCAQGSHTWECGQAETVSFLRKHGLEAHFDYGRMD